MAHVGLAMAFRSPDLELAETEAERLSGCLQKVMRHYDIPDIASETKDWIGLIICCGSIYGPRISASMMEKNIAAAKAQSEADGTNVVHMTVAQ